MAQSVELTANSSRLRIKAIQPREENPAILVVGPRVPPARGIDMRLTAPVAGVTAPGRGRLLRWLWNPLLPARKARAHRPAAARSGGTGASRPGRGTYRR